MSWFFLEILFRLDPRLEWKDIDMLMEYTGSKEKQPDRQKFINAFNNTCNRGRQGWSIISWREKSKNSKDNVARDTVLAGLTPNQIAANTTRGLTPGPNLQGGVVPLPPARRPRGPNKRPSKRTTGAAPRGRRNNPIEVDENANDEAREADNVDGDADDYTDADADGETDHEVDLLPQPDPVPKRKRVTVDVIRTHSWEDFLDESEVQPRVKRQRQGDDGEESIMHPTGPRSKRKRATLDDISRPSWADSLDDFDVTPRVKRQRQEDNDEEPIMHPNVEVNRATKRQVDWESEPQSEPQANKRRRVIEPREADFEVPRYGASRYDNTTYVDGLGDQLQQIQGRTRHLKDRSAASSLPRLPAYPARGYRSHTALRSDALTNGYTPSVVPSTFEDFFPFSNPAPPTNGYTQPVVPSPPEDFSVAPPFSNATPFSDLAPLSPAPPSPFPNPVQINEDQNQGHLDGLCDNTASVGSCDAASTRDKMTDFNSTFEWFDNDEPPPFFPQPELEIPPLLQDNSQPLPAASSQTFDDMKPAEPETHQQICPESPEEAAITKTVEEVTNTDTSEATVGRNDDDPDSEGTLTSPAQDSWLHHLSTSPDIQRRERDHDKTQIGGVWMKKFPPTDPTSPEMQRELQAIQRRHTCGTLATIMAPENPQDIANARLRAAQQVPTPLPVFPPQWPSESSNSSQSGGGIPSNATPDVAQPAPHQAVPPHLVPTPYVSDVMRSIPLATPLHQWAPSEEFPFSPPAVPHPSSTVPWEMEINETYRKHWWRKRDPWPEDPAMWGPEWREFIESHDAEPLLKVHDPDRKP